jgi:hypothetical protein
MQATGERPFTYVGTPTGTPKASGDTGISAGGTSSISIQIDTDADFIIERRDLVISLNGAQSSSIAGTPYPYESLATLASNTFPTLALIRIDLRTGGGIQYQNGPINAKAWCTRNGETYPVTRQRIGRSETLIVTIYNDSPYTINAMVVLEGKKVFGR